MKVDTTPANMLLTSALAHQVSSYAFPHPSGGCATTPRGALLASKIARGASNNGAYRSSSTSGSSGLTGTHNSPAHEPSGRKRTHSVLYSSDYCCEGDSVPHRPSPEGLRQPTWESSQQDEQGEDAADAEAQAAAEVLVAMRRSQEPWLPLAVAAAATPTTASPILAAPVSSVSSPMKASEHQPGLPLAKRARLHTFDNDHSVVGAAQLVVAAASTASSFAQSCVLLSWVPVCHASMSGRPRMPLPDQGFHLWLGSGCPPLGMVDHSLCAPRPCLLLCCAAVCTRHPAQDSTGHPRGHQGDVAGQALHAHHLWHCGQAAARSHLHHRR